MKIQTPRLLTSYRSAGSPSGRPILFLHGNASCSRIWEPILERVNDSIYALAPDLRMYGDSNPADRIDPGRGVSDWAKDLEAFVQAMIPSREHGITIVAHSLGAMVAYRMLAHQKVPIREMCLYAPPPPSGFESRGPDPAFVEALIHKNREIIKKVVNALFWHPSHLHPHIEDIIDDVLKMQVGDHAYPIGIIEAVSPKANAGLESTLLEINQKPLITWVYGRQDLLIGNAGQNTPDSNLIDQNRSFLQKYASAGGSYREISYDNCGHSPYLEKLEEQERLLRSFY